MKSVIKIGGVKCDLDDMPDGFRKKIEEKLRDEGLDDDEEKEIEEEDSNEKNLDRNKYRNKRNGRKVKDVHIFRKMFGYKSGIFENR